jgi:sugar-specific transcriptional regulator TrmB
LENPGIAAGRLCNLTGIPDSKIYRALDDLQRKWKLIEVRKGNPSLYRALNPDQIVEGLRQNVQQEYAEKLETLERVRKTIIPLAKKAAEPDELEIAYIVKGKHNVAQRLRNAIEESQKQVLLLTCDRDILETVLPAILQAKKRRVLVRQAVTPDLAEEAGAAGSVKELICHSNLLLVDNSKLITISNWDSDKCHAIVSDDPVMTSMAREYYDNPKCCC